MEAFAPPRSPGRLMPTMSDESAEDRRASSQLPKAMAGSIIATPGIIPKP
jgi:hypothetical protein